MSITSPSPTRRARPLMLVSALLLALLAGLAGAGTAQAHEELESSDPPAGASLTTAPREIRLVFSGTVRPGTATVAVTGPGGSRWEAGPATSAGETVTVGLRTLEESGSYTVGYRVVSDDGHLNTGSTSFRLTLAPAPSRAAAPAAVGPGDDAGPVAAPARPQAAASETRPGDVAPLTWTFAVGALIALSAATAVAVRRRR